MQGKGWILGLVVLAGVLVLGAILAWADRGYVPRGQGAPIADCTIVRSGGSFKEPFSVCAARIAELDCVVNSRGGVWCVERGEGYLGR